MPVRVMVGGCDAGMREDIWSDVIIIKILALV